MPTTNSEIEAALPWFLAQLKPNGFTTAKLNLQKQGYRTFMPMRQTEVRHARKVTTVMRPLFPGYIFVSFDPELEQWRTINSTYCVSSLIVNDANSPQVVPLDLMEPMLAGCGESDLVLPPEMLVSGDVVKVVNGPFKDIVATVESLSSNDPIVVLLDLMGRVTRVEIARQRLEVAAVKSRS